MKTVIPWSPGQFGESFGIDPSEMGLRQQVPAAGIPTEPSAPLLPEGRGGGRGEIDGVAHTKNLPFVKFLIGASGCGMRPGSVIIFTMAAEF